MAETRSGASPTRDRAAGVFARVLQAWSPPVFARALVRLGLRIDSRRVSKLAFRLGIAAALLAHGLGMAAGQDLTFSHRRHLARGATRCETCHASALTSTAAQDNQLPKEETCLACHDGAQARKDCAVCHRDPQRVSAIRLPARNFRFNHKLHLGLGNVAAVLAQAIDRGAYLGSPGDLRRFLNTDNACAACHRGMAEADLATEAHLPRMADCLVCHTRIDPPFSCAFCHTPEAVLKPASHTSGFTDAHSSRVTVPDKSSCKVCHGVKFTCMGCH